MSIAVTYFVEPGLPAPLGPFDILVDGTRVASYVPDHSSSGFFAVHYEMPPALTRGKGRVTLRFQAVGTGRIAPVFSVRTFKR